ncbi:MAG: helix-turn-helix domain-containing protein, partial [Candidatus Sedimenticola endophacoides]
MRVAVSIELKDEERQLLERLSRSRSTSVRLAERSRIVLLAAQKKTNGKIAEELEISRQKAGRWRDRYQQFGLAGIEKDAPRPGRKNKISSRKVKKIIELTTQE